MKKNTFCLLLLGLLLIFLSAPKLNAQQIDMYGNVGFDRVGGYVTLSASRIQNMRPLGNTSGTLALQLWATSMPYYGQSMLNGFKLAEANLGTLRGGYYLSNINRTVVFSEPPVGYYNVVLVVGEWNGSEYLTADWINFTEVENFGGLPPYTPAITPQPLDLIDEYVGTWEGTQNFVYNGTSFDTTSTSVIMRFQNAGFYSKAIVRTPGNVVAEGEIWQFDNGSMYGIVKSEGVVIGTSTGTWYINGRSIISNISAVAGSLTYTQFVNAYFPDSKTANFSSTTSYGAVGSGVAKKISTATLLALTAPQPPAQTPSVAPAPAASGGGSAAPVAKSKKGKGKSSSAKKSSGGSSKKSGGKKKSKK
jgi:hypothetical protein